MFFKVMGSSPQTLGAVTEKAHLCKLSLVLGTISCCEMDDLSCLGIFNRCIHVIHKHVFVHTCKCWNELNSNKMVASLETNVRL